jgi:hypothetical protein
LAPAAAGSAPVHLGDVPGTGGQWQQGSTVVAAPLPEVRRWLTDYDAWPALFPDVEWATVLARDGDLWTVRFRSRIVGRDLTIRVRISPTLLVYVGTGKDVTTEGKVYLKALDRQHTSVLMQSSATVHGLAGAFVGTGTKRKRALRKIGADLSALHALASRSPARM